MTNAGKLLDETHSAYLLLHTEPELDAPDPQLARERLLKAKMVVVMSPYRHGADYADVMLPVSPFTETAGTYINCEGRPQHFQGAVKPYGQTRPAWKVLRVLGNLLEFDGFAHESAEAVRDDFFKEAGQDWAAKLNNNTGLLPIYTPVPSDGLERLTDIPSCFSDPIVRRAVSMQKMPHAQANRVCLSVAHCERLGVRANDWVSVHQGENHALLSVVPDERLPDNVVRIHAGHEVIAMLGPLFGTLDVRVA
jgi:NADH-quinone oxidoreductase subunit G